MSLIDCPGLVFPSFSNSKAEMYCCCVLPIQTIVDFRRPIQLIVERVPRDVLMAKYKIRLPERDCTEYTVENFLNAFALKKGWITGNSNPNVAQAAKYVLKDYTTGALVYVNLRPDYDIENHGEIVQSGFNMENMPAAEEPTGENVPLSEASTVGGATAPVPVP